MVKKDKNTAKSSSNIYFYSFFSLLNFLYLFIVIIVFSQGKIDLITTLVLLACFEIPFFLSIAIFLLVYRNKISKDGKLFCNFWGFDLYSFKFSLKEVKQILIFRYITNNEYAIHKNYRYNTFPFLLKNINKKGYTSVQEKEFVLYKKYVLEKKSMLTKYSKLNNSFLGEYEKYLNDGLKGLFSKQRYCVLFLANEINEFSYETFNFNCASSIYSHLKTDKNIKMLGIMKFNEKIMDKVYSEVDVKTVILGYPNVYFRKDEYKDAFTQDINKEFYDLEIGNSVEPVYERRKYIFYEYLKKKYPTKEIIFEGGLLNEKQ